MTAVDILSSSALDSPQSFGLSFIKEKTLSSSLFFDRFALPELRRLQIAADDAGISILFFKGIIEKYDTYHAYDLNRPYWDIDLLVDPEHVWEFYQLCLKFGFLSDSVFNTKYDFDLYITDSHHHLPVQYKFLLNQSVPLYLEIHFALTPGWNTKPNCWSLVKDILEIKAKHQYTGLYSMPPEDRFVFSFLYASNDYLPSFSKYYFQPNSQLINGKPLADAWLILNKYHDQLDFAIIKTRIIQFGLENHLLFGIGILRMAFQCSHLEPLLNDLEIFCCDASNHSTHSFADNVLKSSYLAAKDNSNFSLLSFYKSSLFYCIAMNETVLLPFDFNVIILLKGTNATTPVTLKRNADLLVVSVDFQKDSMSFWTDGDFAYDCINLRIYNPDYSIELDNAVRNIFVCFKESNGAVIPDITFNGASPIHRGTLTAQNVSAKVTKQLYGFHLDIFIPWELQNIIFSRVQWIGFECTIQIVKQEKVQFLYWSNGFAPHYNPAKFGKIIFQ